MKSGYHSAPLLVGQQKDAVVIQAQADVKSSMSWQKNLPVSVCSTHDIQAGRRDLTSVQVRIRKPIAPSHHRNSPRHRLYVFLPAERTEFQFLVVVSHLPTSQTRFAQCSESFYSQCVNFRGFRKI